MKTASKALLARSREELAAAELLTDKGFHATSASRAYYAMFYAAEALLLDEGLEFSSHGAVHAAIGERFVKAGRLDAKFHRYLLDAFRERQAADYDAPPEVDAEDVSALLANARGFVQAIEQLLA